MTTPSLPAAVRDTINRIVHDYEDEPALDCVNALTAALGPVWAAHEADSKRLDWLDKNLDGSFGPAVCKQNPHPIHQWCFDAPVYDTLRAAIDAARKEEDSIQ